MLQNNDILIIGGPQTGAVNEPKIDRIECSYDGIRTGPSLRNYRAVVYWPNRNLFSIPTKARWDSLRNKYPTCFPVIPDSFWKGKLKPLPSIRVNWLGAGTTDKDPTMDPVAKFIRRIAEHTWYLEDRAALEKLLLDQCIKDLWALLLGSKDGQLVIAVVPDADDGTIPHLHRAYSWLSQWFVALPGSDTKKPRRFEPKIESLPDIFLREFPPEWLTGNKPRYSFANNDPENLRSLMGKELWRTHLLRDDADFDNLPESVQKLGLVDVTAAHSTDMENAKTLLFRTGKGGVAVIPEPPTLQDLIALVLKAIQLEVRTGSTTDVNKSIILTTEHNKKAAKHRTRKVLVGEDILQVPNRQFLRLLCLVIAKELPQGSIDPSDPKLGNIDVTDLCWDKGSDKKSHTKFASEVNKVFREKLGVYPVDRPASNPQTGHPRVLRAGLSIDVSRVISIPKSDWPAQIEAVVACLKQLSAHQS